ncbi:MAG: 30S ribosomal protein S24e [Candidatus Heimdallarchaeota archaeon]|nr:30S ribosomal protein S24e [Candidatus Heimdallarchaeota archaeon]
MEIKVLEKTKNPLLSREEITFKIDHENAETPSREGVIGKLAAILNAEKERTILKELNSNFGTNTAFGLVYLYDSADIAMNVEPKHILKRNGLIQKEAS